MPITQQQQQQQQQQGMMDPFSDDTYNDEIEKGSGYLIRSRLPNLKNSEHPQQVHLPSGPEIQKYLDEANALERRADAGEKEALEAAKVHEELRLQAEEMARNTKMLEEEALAREQQLLFNREQLRKEENELEKLRAIKHDDVLKAEALRAQAKADALLQQKKFDHAKRLISRHTEGQQMALAQVQRYRLERQEAELLRQRVNILQSKKPVESWIPTELPPIKVQVTVQPEEIPEARVAGHEQTRGASAGSIIGAQLRAKENQLRSEAQQEAQHHNRKVQNMGIQSSNEQVINPNYNLLAEIKEKGAQHNWLHSTHGQQQQHVSPALLSEIQQRGGQHDWLNSPRQSTYI